MLTQSGLIVSKEYFKQFYQSCNKNELKQLCLLNIKLSKHHFNSHCKNIYTRVYIYRVGPV